MSFRPVNFKLTFSNVKFKSAIKPDKEYSNILKAI